MLTTVGPTLVRRHLHWEPSVSLEEGMERTYRWIYDRLATGKPASSFLVPTV